MEWAEAYAAIFRTHNKQLHPVHEIDPIRLQSLVCIDRQKADLAANTERFVSGLPANNALLWGARGTGKSSLIKAVLNEYAPRGLRLIEIYKTDLIYLPEITDEVRGAPQKFLIYCDDFSFEENDGSYVALKNRAGGFHRDTPRKCALICNLQPAAPDA